MSWLSKIGAWVGAVFTGGVNKETQALVHDSVRGIGTWIDERDFTEEERQKANMEILVKYGQFLDNTVNENSDRSRTRRALAIWIIRVEAFLLISSIPLAVYNPALAEYVYKVAVDSPWGLLTLGVGAFFFGTHLLRGTPMKDKQS